MNTLYPLKFKPLFYEKIWGGHKLRDILGMNYGNLPNCGEAWLLSGLKGKESLVTNGFLEDNELNELVEVYMGDLVGDEVYERFGDEFPLLIKLVDSADFLSLQVHPGDDLARKRHDANGKSEMWYIMDADPGATIISGFDKKLKKEEYLEYLEERKLKEVLHIENALKGDVFYTPAGRVHAIGPGILLAEIQQSSDYTYRIYDWDRVDEKGNSRELHTDLALDAIDFSVVKDSKTHYTLKTNGSTDLLRTPHFVTSLIHTSQVLKKDYSEVDSFVIYLCTEGKCKVMFAEGSVHLVKGETLLIPNVINLVGIVPEIPTTILEVYVPL